MHRQVEENFIRLRHLKLWEGTSEYKETARCLGRIRVNLRQTNIRPDHFHCGQAYGLGDLHYLIIYGTEAIR